MGAVVAGADGSGGARAGCAADVESDSAEKIGTAKSAITSGEEDTGDEAVVALALGARDPARISDSGNATVRSGCTKWGVDCSQICDP